MSAPALSTLESWMVAKGITWDRSLIRLVNNAPGCSGLALGVHAVRDVSEGDHLCHIPKAACISIRNSEISDIIEKEELGGGLGLVLAVLHELSLGAESQWHGYLEALPRREYLPVFWSDEELQLLEGTEAEHKPLADREHMAEDFEAHVLPLAQRYPGRLRGGALTLDNFRVAASWVASRAFGIDEFHGDAMVPLADIFNHKASVVELAPGYSVHGAESSSDEEEEEEESDGDEASGGKGEGEEEPEGTLEEGGEGGREAREGVVTEGQAAEPCGEPGCCSGHGHSHGHQHHGNGQAPDAGGPDRAPAGAILRPAGAGSGRAHSTYGIATANGLHLCLEIAILDKGEHLEIVAASAVPAGAEVHNTYGEHGNAELLCKYGFALRDNPFTAVSLDKAELLAAAREELGARAYKARCRFLEGETEVLDPEEEPFEVLPNGHISPALFVALRVLGAEEAEAKQWGSIADVLKLPAAAEGKAAEADGREGGAGGGAEEEEGDESVPAVQLWPVRGEAASAAAAGSTEPAEPAKQPQHAQQPGQQNPTPPSADDSGSGPTEEPGPSKIRPSGAHESRAAQLAALLSPRACSILCAAVEARLRRYPGTLEADRRQWEQRHQQQEQQLQQQGSESLTEHASAVLGALLLRLTEREVLQEMMDAIAQRAQHAHQTSLGTSGQRRGAAKRQRKDAGAGEPGSSAGAEAGKRPRRQGAHKGDVPELGDKRVARAGAQQGKAAASKKGR